MSSPHVDQYKKESITFTSLRLAINRTQWVPSEFLSPMELTSMLSLDGLARTAARIRPTTLVEVSQSLSNIKTSPYQINRNVGGYYWNETSIEAFQQVRH